MAFGDPYPQPYPWGITIGGPVTTVRLGGWQCPGCGRCWNPSVLSCEHCGPKPATPSEDLTAPVAYGEISDLCVPASEGGLCDHDSEAAHCTGGRHCSC